MKSKKQTKNNPQKTSKEPKPKSNIIQTKDPLSILNSSIKETLIQLGYETLTKVQQKMILEILATNKQKNIICKSNKGSGKILSFLLPIVHQILENEKNNKEERYIIITGIKERAHELYSMSKELLRDINGKKVCMCVGGANRKKENLKLMENDVKLIISTPQRIIEYIKNDKGKKLVLNKDIKTIIFDKIESMEINGYMKDLKDIINIYGFEKIKESKNNEKKIVNDNINFIFYCQNDENDINDDTQINNINQSYINELINFSERKYDTIIIKEANKKLGSNKLTDESTKHKITKRGYIILDPSKKFLFLLTFLRKNPNKKIIVFFATSKEVIFYNSLFNLYHLETSMIYSSSSKSIKENQEILSKFSKAEKAFLLCTDLSKMRLDIPICDWILFYDAPIDIESFEANLVINNIDKNSLNKIEEIKAFMILMQNEIDLLKEKKEINIIEFNLNMGNIDKDQEKVEKLVNTKQQNVLVNAFDAYKEFLFNYASRSNKDIFNLDNIDVSKLCKSFGFKFPPYINFSSLMNYESISNEKKNKKKSFLFPEEIEKIYGNKD
jgi:ATP-dependent RNA helicase DDX18/HAS1